MRIDRQARPYAVVLFSLAALLGVAWSAYAALPPLALLIFVLWFFRDPERRSPELPGVLLSPADGRIIRNGPQQISIFMNVFDVHICRAPISGRVERTQHHPGSFATAFKDSASEHNERTEIRIVGDDEQVDLSLVAGLVARRIVCRVGVGQQLHAGQRIGLIQFGSRVDLRLPPGFSSAVRLKQRVVAGETVLARRSG